MMSDRELKTELVRHHYARLEMMMAEERGIELSYEDAVKIINSKIQSL